MKHRSFPHSLPSRRRTLHVALALIGGLLLLLPASAAAAPNVLAGSARMIFDWAATPSWAVSVGGPGPSNDEAVDVKMAAGGVTYVAGTMGNPAGHDDVSLLKLVNGVQAWGSPKTYDSPFHHDDFAAKMALGPGKVIYTAASSNGSQGNYDILLVKWSANGTVLWARRYDGPAHSHDIATAVGVDSKGNVTVVGHSEGPHGHDWVAVNWSAAGVRRWSWRYDGKGHADDYPADLLVAGDGSVYLTGSTFVAPMTYAALTVRLSPVGKRLWAKTYAGPEGLGAGGAALASRPGGGVYVCGFVHSSATGSDGLVMRYGRSGSRSVFALDTVAGPSDQWFRDVAVASSGRVVAVGESRASGTMDCHVVVYRTGGTIAGSLTVPGAWDDEFTAVATDSFGGYYATGTQHVAADHAEIFTARGSVLTGGGGWISLWDAPVVSVNNHPMAIAVRGTSACVVGAFETGGPAAIDQIVLGYVY